MTSLHAASSLRTVRFLATRVQLRVHWEDEDVPTVLEFSSKAAAIDWLASQADRPMSVATLIPVKEEQYLSDEALLRIPAHKRVTAYRTLEQAKREKFEASERLKAARNE